MAVFLLKNEDAQCTRLIEGLTFRHSWEFFSSKNGSECTVRGWWWLAGIFWAQILNGSLFSKNVFFRFYFNEQFSRARVTFFDLLEQRDISIFVFIIMGGNWEKKKVLEHQLSPFVKKIYHTQISKCTANMEKFTLFCIHIFRVACVGFCF